MSRRPVDVAGERFGMLVAKAYESGRWSCACDCGGSFAAEPTRLRSGLVLDCGCLAEVSRRDLIEGMVAQRQLIAELQAQQVAPEPAAEAAVAPTRSSRRAPVPSRSSSPSAGGRIDPVAYALRKARQERQAQMVLR